MSLTKEEKSLVKDVFRKGKNKERNFKVYNMTVARLYFGEQENWQYSGHLGAAVVVSEYPKDADESTTSPYASYICLVDLTSSAIIFTQEIYDEFMYVKAKAYFHHFETNMSVAGLSFANEEEAAAFYNCVVEVTHKTLTEKEEKKAVIPVTRPAKPRTPKGGESFFDVVIVDDEDDKKKKKKKRGFKKFKKSKKGKRDKKDKIEGGEGGGKKNGEEAGGGGGDKTKKDDDDDDDSGSDE